MKTLWDATARAELATRLARLDAQSTPRWGKLNCAQMLAHVADGVRMTLGDLKCQPKGGPLRFWPLKQLIIYWLPFPKGAPTAPELLARPAVSIEQERAALLNLLEQLTARAGQTAWPEHPAFGPLSAQDWGALVYKHVDHHLRQFGV